MYDLPIDYKIISFTLIIVDIEYGNASSVEHKRSFAKDAFFFRKEKLHCIDVMKQV